MNPVLLRKISFLGGLFFAFLLLLFSLNAKPSLAQYCDPTCYSCGTYSDCGDYCGACCTPGPVSCSGWSSCSASCDGGTQDQYCTDGCDSWSETQTCNTQPCLGVTPPPPTGEDCGLSGYTCLDGTQPHTYCDPNCADPVSCHDDPPCEWPEDCNKLGGDAYCAGLGGGGCLDPTCPGTPVCNVGGDCATDCNSCPTPSHLTCQESQCVSVIGVGINTCASDVDCGGGYHFDCQGTSCSIVAGSGTNSCGSDSDCEEPPTPPPGVCPTSWAPVGTFDVGCNTTIPTNFSASMVKFTMTSGGGDDNRISFYDGGSNGASWTTSDGGLYHVTNQSGALTVGESRWTEYFGPKTGYPAQLFGWLS